MKRYGLALSLLLLVGAGCATTAPSPPPPTETPSESVDVSFDGTWDLKIFTSPGKAAQDASKLGLTMTVDDDTRLSAKICNSMSGAYTMNGDIMKVEALMSTKMFCAGLAGEIETAFSQGLSSGMTFDHGEDTLDLSSVAGEKFSFARAPDNARIGDDSNDNPSEDRTYAGVVTSVDLEKVAVDGPAVVILRTAAGTEAKILVPSFGLGLCKAKASIADVYELKVGDAVEARGSVGAESAIVPCQSEAHYLRVTSKK